MAITHVIALTAEQAEALLFVFESAEQGRADFEYVVSLGGQDYTRQDIAIARAKHEREVAVATFLRTQICG